jgi:hypothetical protein
VDTRRRGTLKDEEKVEVRKAKMRLRHAKLRRKAARIAKKLAALEGRSEDE